MINWKHVVRVYRARMKSDRLNWVTGFDSGRAMGRKEGREQSFAFIGLMGMAEAIRSRDLFVSQEPKIHSGCDDILPDDHPLVNETVYCAECRNMLHCGYNECMTTWIEFSDANVCAECVGSLEDLWRDSTWAAFKAERARRLGAP